ncbi:hypothetical protein Tco_0878409 [Tanacetum coccineum]|uniref:Uncharacterized protein n=1 Tax=Tanacetum coccineum TaxID=301880 RepID=A0ABQ5BZF2_9ASTR
MMEAYTKRINQQREQEAVREQELREQELAAQREQELLAQKQAAQEKEEPPQNSDFRQIIREVCDTKVCEEQKQKLEDTMLELLEDCRQKELYCMHNHVEDLIESALNYKLLLINLKSQRLDKEKQEVKNISEPAAKHRTRITSYLQNFKVIHKESAISLNNTPQISPVIAITHDLPTEELEYSLSIGDEHLSTILEKESDEVIKSSVENLVPIPSESEVTSDNESECDVPGEINIDIIQIKDELLREKLLNVNLLIDKIEALNLTPSIPFVLKYPSSSPIPVVDSDFLIEEVENISFIGRLDNHRIENWLMKEPGWVWYDGGHDVVADRMDDFNDVVDGWIVEWMLFLDDDGEVVVVVMRLLDVRWDDCDVNGWELDVECVMECGIVRSWMLFVMMMEGGMNEMLWRWMNDVGMVMEESVCDDSSPLNIPKGNSVTFSNPLFDSNDDFTSSDNESLSDEDVPKDVKIYSNPLFEFDDEYISSDVNTLFDKVLEDIECKDSYDSNLDESTFLVTPFFDSNKDECFTPSDDVELLLHYDPSISVVSILEGFTDEPLLEENEDLFDLESKEYDWKKILYDPRIDDLISEDKVFDPEIHEIIFFSNIWKLIL